MDLTGPSGFPRAVGDPAAYVTADGTQHVIYRDGDGNLHELWWTTGAPGHVDLTGPFGSPRAAPWAIQRPMSRWTGPSM